ncbi:MAG: ATP-binding protein [Candidatus Saccharimonadales bacterium]
MFDIYLLIDIIVVISLLLLGLIGLAKNKQAKLNRSFMFFVICVSVWIIANYISNDIQQSEQVARNANLLVFSFSYFATFFMLRFTIDLADDTRARQILRFATVPLVICGMIAATPLVVAGVHVQGNLYAVEFGPAIAVYGIALFATILSTMYVLWRNMKKTTGVIHARMRVLFISLIVSLPLLIFAQFILPTATGWFGLTNIGVLAMLGIVYGLYYSVAKHRLFDLRPIIVRSIAYILTLSALTLGYSFVIYKTSNLIVIQNSEFIHYLLNTVLILTVILAYQPLKQFFKRMTNKIFYQDMYDATILYAELNKILVSTIEINQLAKKTSELIASTINVEFCSIGIVQPESGLKIIGKNTFLAQESLDDLYHALDTVKQRAVITEQLEHTNQTAMLTLDKFEIAAVVSLQSRTKGVSDSMGYLFLGLKRTGYSFNQEDIRILENIANELTIAIQNALHFEEIQQFNVTLQGRVDEATRKYRATNEKLKNLDETKDEFISMASHQLRTPLTSVKGYLSMVLEGDVGTLNKQQEELLKQSYLSSQRMVNLIADLLNLSRLNTGKFIIDPHPIDLRDVVDSELMQLRETAKAKDIELVYKKPDSFPILNIDENKIHQVVMNFADNAIYYTPNGGKITVELRETPTAIEYTVTDTGIGVPREVQRHLFTKFYRADNAKRARPDGTGLGLFMAKKVIIAQGGSVIFDSEEGRGSTFGFRFNKSQLAVPDTKV